MTNRPFLLCIDPGNYTGWSVFNTRTHLMLSAGLTNIAEDSELLAYYFGGAETALIERPNVYDKNAHAKRVSPDDILKLAINVGRWTERAASRGAAIEYVEPRRWKGQTPKEIHNARVVAALTAEESRALPILPKSKFHNCLDAIGLGLWRYSRIR